MGSHFLIFFKENLYGKWTLRGSDQREKVDRLNEIGNVKLGIIFRRLGKKVHVIFVTKKLNASHTELQGMKKPPRGRFQWEMVRAGM